MASIAVRVRMPKRTVRQSECGSGCCDALPDYRYDGVSAAAKPAGNILTVAVVDAALLGLATLIWTVFEEQSRLPEFDGAHVAQL